MSNIKKYPHAADKCPSNHHNPGDDICADCGTDLNGNTLPITFAAVDDLTFDAINAVAKLIQDRIGQTDGGVAGIHFSKGEEPFDAMSDIVLRYLEAEQSHSDEPLRIIPPPKVTTICLHGVNRQGSYADGSRDNGGKIVKWCVYTRTDFDEVGKTAPDGFKIEAEADFDTYEEALAEAEKRAKQYGVEVTEY